MAETKNKNSDKTSSDGIGAEKDKKAKNLHKGHRQSVKERYYVDGMNGMPDHNILEMLLFFAIPYKDTNDTAHLLMERFGSFSGVLQASLEQLKSVKGMTENAACLITMLLPIYRRYHDDLMHKKPDLMSTKDIVAYMRPKFIDTTNERVYAICFDNNHHLITNRLLCEGSIESAAFNLRDLARAVIETKAVEVVLVHNHPAGVALPSHDDVRTTVSIYRFLRFLRVTLTDHIIITKEGFCSMSAIKKYSKIFHGYDVDEVYMGFEKKFDF